MSLSFPYCSRSLTSESQTRKLYSVSCLFCCITVRVGLQSCSVRRASTCSLSNISARFHSLNGSGNWFSEHSLQRYLAARSVSGFSHSCLPLLFTKSEGVRTYDPQFVKPQRRAKEWIVKSLDTPYSVRVDPCL